MTGDLDTSDANIQHDLQNPLQPHTAIGTLLIVMLVAFLNRLDVFGNNNSLVTVVILMVVALDWMNFENSSNSINKSSVTRRGSSSSIISPH